MKSKSFRKNILVKTTSLSIVGFSAIQTSNAALYSINNWELRNIVGQTANGGVTGSYGTLTTTYISSGTDTDHLFQFS